MGTQAHATFWAWIKAKCANPTCHTTAGFLLEDGVGSTTTGRKVIPMPSIKIGPCPVCNPTEDQNAPGWFVPTGNMQAKTFTGPTSDPVILFNGNSIKAAYSDEYEGHRQAAGINKPWGS